MAVRLPLWSYGLVRVMLAIGQANEWAWRGSSLSKQLVCIHYVKCLKQAVVHTNTRSNTPDPAPTTTTRCPALPHPRSRLSSLLPAAAQHRPPSPTNSPPRPKYRAPAGRAPLADQANAMYGVYRRRPANQRVTPRPRVPAGYAAPLSPP